MPKKTGTPWTDELTATNGFTTTTRRTELELSLLRALAQGHNTAQAAARLGLTYAHAKNIVAQLRTRNNARTNAQLVAKATRARVIS